MARGGAILAKTFRRLRHAAYTGITTKELDELARKLVLSYGAKPAFLGYASGASGKKFPASLCVSVGDEVVHGIPGTRFLKDGDIAGLDLGVLYNGFYTDSAITIGIGAISKKAQRLIEVTERALYLGIDMARLGNTTGDIGQAVQSYVEAQGFSVVRDLVGHGIGRELHEEPQVPNYGKVDRGIKLEEGMVVAIEPMVTEGSWQVVLSPDGWTYKTADGSLSAHFEHTVAITKKGPRILTK